MLQGDVETALACSDVTQLDVSAIVSVNDDPQHVLRLSIKRQARFLNECRDMKASVASASFLDDYLYWLAVVVGLAVKVIS